MTIAKKYVVLWPRAVRDLLAQGSSPSLSSRRVPDARFRRWVQAPVRIQAPVHVVFGAARAPLVHLCFSLGERAMAEADLRMAIVARRYEAEARRSEAEARRAEAEMLVQLAAGWAATSKAPGVSPAQLGPRVPGEVAPVPAQVPAPVQLPAPVPAQAPSLVAAVPVPAQVPLPPPPPAAAVPVQVLAQGPLPPPPPVAAVPAVQVVPDSSSSSHTPPASARSRYHRRHSARSSRSRGGRSMEREGRPAEGAAGRATGSAGRVHPGGRFSGATRGRRAGERRAGRRRSGHSGDRRAGATPGCAGSAHPGGWHSEAARGQRAEDRRVWSAPGSAGSVHPGGRRSMARGGRVAGGSAGRAPGSAGSVHLGGRHVESTRGQRAGGGPWNATHEHPGGRRSREHEEQGGRPAGGAPPRNLKKESPRTVAGAHDFEQPELADAARKAPGQDRHKGRLDLLRLLPSVGEVPAFRPRAKGAEVLWNAPKMVFWGNRTRRDCFPVPEHVPSPSIGVFEDFLRGRLDGDRCSVLYKLGEPTAHEGHVWSFPILAYDTELQLADERHVGGSKPEWRTAWHGTKMERVYGILFHGRLAASFDESAGHRFLSGLPGVYVHEKFSNALHYAPYTQLCRDGLFWRVVMQVAVNRGNKVPLKGKQTNQWIQPEGTVVLKALTVQCTPYDKMEDGDMVMEHWLPWREQSPRGVQFMDHDAARAAGVADGAAAASAAPAATPDGSADAANESDDAWMSREGVLGADEQENPSNPKGGGKEQRAKKPMRRGNRDHRDWFCSSCGDYRNFAWRTVCNSCGRPRAEGAATEGGYRSEESTFEEAVHPKRRRWRSESE